MIFQRSTNVPQLSDYTRYRDPYLRPDFCYRCAYCLTHEFYFLQGDGGEIDHFRPLNPPEALGLDFSHLKNTYDNLYWSCGKCNAEKGNLWPGADEYQQGFRFLDPCIQDHDDHLDTYPDGTSTAKTNTGLYTIKHIWLDRRRLQELRRFLFRFQEKFAAIQEELLRNDLSPEMRAMLLEWLEDIRPWLEPPVFTL